MRFIAQAITLSCAVAIVGAVATACQGSSEGQPCSTLGNDMGDSECKDGLVCTPQGLLNGGYTKDVCCPSNRATATTLICMLPANPVPDAGPPADVGSPDTSADTGSEDTGTTDAPLFDGVATDTGTSPGDAKVDGTGTSDAHAGGG